MKVRAVLMVALLSIASTPSFAQDECDAIRRDIARLSESAELGNWIRSKYSAATSECLKKVAREYDSGNCSYASVADGLLGDQNDRVAQVVWEAMAMAGSSYAAYVAGNIAKRESDDAVHKKCRSIVDRRKALDFYRRGADAGDTSAMIELGLLYASGAYGLVDPNYDKAASLFEQSYKKRGVTRPLHRTHLNNLIEVGQEANWYLAHDAYYRMLLISGVPQDEKDRMMLELAREAASRGHPGAMWWVAKLIDTYVPGEPEVMKWYIEAGNRGQVDGYCDAATEIYLANSRDGYYLALVSEAAGSWCEDVKNKTKNVLNRETREEVEDAVEQMLPWDSSDSLIYDPRE